MSRVDYLITEKNKNDDEFTQWSIERSCSNECKNFCVTMGTRTKVTYCTSCCNEPECNVGNYSANTKKSSIVSTFLSNTLLFILARNIEFG